MHDEIILEVPERRANDAAVVVLRETMIQGGKAFPNNVPVEVGVTVADTGLSLS